MVLNILSTGQYTLFIVDMNNLKLYSKVIIRTTKQMPKRLHAKQLLETVNLFKRLQLRVLIFIQL